MKWKKRKDSSGDEIIKNMNLIKAKIELYEDFIIELAKIMPHGSPLTEEEDKRHNFLFQMQQKNGFGKGFPFAEYSALIFKHDPSMLAEMVKQQKVKR